VDRTPPVTGNFYCTATQIGFTQQQCSVVWDQT